MTGGSFAKISRRMARKSRMLDFWIGIPPSAVAETVTRGRVTHIPIFCPPHQVRMIDLALWINMLSWPDHHSLHRCDIRQRRFMRVAVWNPYIYWKSVCRPSENDS
jgi:hypothetical protein